VDELYINFEKVEIKQQHKEHCFAYYFSAYNSVTNSVNKRSEYRLFQTGEPTKSNQMWNLGLSANQIFRLPSIYNFWNFQQHEKLLKVEHFQIYYISNLLSILPAQLTRCGIHRNRSILGIVENKIITFCFGKELFNQFYFPSKATTFYSGARTIFGRGEGGGREARPRAQKNVFTGFGAFSCLKNGSRYRSQGGQNISREAAARAVPMTLHFWSSNWIFLWLNNRGVK